MLMQEVSRFYETVFTFFPLPRTRRERASIKAVTFHFLSAAVDRQPKLAESLRCGTHQGFRINKKVIVTKWRRSLLENI